MRRMRREDFAMYTILQDGVKRRTHGYTIVGIFVDGEFYCLKCGFKKLGMTEPKNQADLRTFEIAQLREGETDLPVHVSALSEFYDGSLFCNCGYEVVDMTIQEEK